MILHAHEFVAYPAAAVQLFPVLRWIVLAACVPYGFKRRTLTAWIFIAMLLGAEIGQDFPNFAAHLRVLALIFLRLIKTIIAPLLFGTLVVGIAGHSNLRQVGRLGLRSIIFFEVVTTIAIFLGLGAINLSKAGVGVQLPPSTNTDTSSVGKLSAEDTILHVFPENIAKSVADGAVLQVVVFSLIFAVALAMISEEKRRPMLAFCESLSETMFKFTNIVMYMAPLGVGAAIAYTVGHSGLGVLGSLLKLLLTLYAALVVFILGVLLPIALICRVPLRAFLKARRRAGDNRLRHGQLRGRFTPRHGSNGGDRRAAADRRLRYPDRLQFQPDGKLALSLGRGDLRGAGLRHPSHVWPAAHDHADADAHQ